MNGFVKWVDELFFILLQESETSDNDQIDDG